MPALWIAHRPSGHCAAQCALLSGVPTMNEDIFLFLVAVVGSFLAGSLLAGTVVWFLRKGGSSPNPRPPVSAGDEVLRIAADPQGGRLLLYINGSPVKQVESIADRKLRQLLRSLLDMLEGAPESDVTPLPTVRPVPAPVATPAPSASELASQPPAPVVSQPATDEPAGPVEAAGVAAPLASTVDEFPLLPDEELSGSFLDRLKSSLTPIGGSTPPTAKPVMPVVRRGNRREPAAPTPPSMFEQIDEILQKKLRAYPSAPDMLIYEDGGELCIRVGREVYHSFDDIKDEHARALIRESVSEWEAR